VPPQRLSALLEPRRRPFVYIPTATFLSFVALLSLPIIGIFASVLFMFALPYWLGERRPKVLVMAAAVMLLATGLLAVTFLTWDSYQPYLPLQTSRDGVLTDGTVNPVFGDEETVFTFRVVYTNSEPPEEPPRVVVTSTFFASRTTMNSSMEQEDPSDSDFEDGVVYVLSTKLPSSTHRFHFVVLLANGTWVATSDAASGAGDSRGPVNTSPATFFLVVAASIIPFVYLMVGIPLLVIIAVYRRMSRARGPDALTQNAE
jgi:hypothetical protein